MMNKIKEEILSRNWMTNDMILNVMDKYAKEVAIDFLEKKRNTYNNSKIRKIGEAFLWKH